MPQQISYRLDNRERNKLYGKPDPGAKVDTQELADKVCVDLAGLSRSLNLYHEKDTFVPLCPIVFCTMDGSMGVGRLYCMYKGYICQEKFFDRLVTFSISLRLPMSLV